MNTCIKSLIVTVVLIVQSHTSLTSADLRRFFHVDSEEESMLKVYTIKRRVELYKGFLGSVKLHLKKGNTLEVSDLDRESFCLKRIMQEFTDIFVSSTYESCAIGTSGKARVHFYSIRKEAKGLSVSAQQTAMTVSTLLALSSLPFYQDC